MRNFQRDGVKRQNVPTGRVAYEPNSLAAEGPRENPAAGFATYPAQESGDKLRIRPASFADHYSQARMFFRSLSEPEQRHVVSAFAFELGKVETVAIRKRMLGHLMVIDESLGAAVEQALGMEGEADRISPARAPIDVAESPALSLIKKARPTLEGRKIGVLVTDGIDEAQLDTLRKAVEKEGATLTVVAPKAGGVKTRQAKLLPADHALSAAPSIFFDAVAMLTSADGATQLAQEAAAIDWLRDAFGHLKVIGHLESAAPLFEKAAIAADADAGLIALESRAGIAAFIAAAKQHRVWAREPTLRSPG
jgi:catalase